MSLSQSVQMSATHLQRVSLHLGIKLHWLPTGCAHVKFLYNSKVAE